MHFYQYSIIYKKYFLIKIKQALLQKEQTTYLARTSLSNCAKPPNFQKQNKKKEKDQIKRIIKELIKIKLINQINKQINKQLKTKQIIINQKQNITNKQITQKQRKQKNNIQHQRMS
ncbi:hypothetical protein TTHERM_001046912 (macronuclear) [Tetrahymena thermophila SB210]|uniref:Uncharacterized protein n=1 Tax=Tetrahymena thermophila (strain SB210) TaxID=312017 RepID=W7X3L9_TETTS|nr:hypothetical protein TTHERM_001046912 [Tetrahymena thermophila SB210]EWS73895.1 hypothetical protein TTHERM_001046912 [Tetrahymena thermophila SB210]|eukprot:XP_012653563.1 hypothetical protein TTHERM_001046912 [Tetrahymena thermophila SB210]